MMVLRKYVQNDCKILAELFYNTVHIVNSKDYSVDQINAWADGKIDLNWWNDSFLKHYTIVAEMDGIIVGFGDISSDGYLDRLYIHHKYQHRGIAAEICDELEQSVNAVKIVTHASITAKGFFEKRGYKVVKQQQVQRKGVLLENYVMEYQL